MKISESVQITIELPQDVFASLRREPTDFVREMRIAAAVKWYEIEMVSQGKAAEIAGLSRAEFIAALGQFGVTPFQVTVDDLINEVTHA